MSFPSHAVWNIKAQLKPGSAGNSDNGPSPEEDLESASGLVGLAEEDELVSAERQRVESGAAYQDTLCLKNLRKVYDSRPPKVNRTSVSDKSIKSQKYLSAHVE